MQDINAFEFQQFRDAVNGEAHELFILCGQHYADPYGPSSMSLFMQMIAKRGTIGAMGRVASILGRPKCAEYARAVYDYASEMISVAIPGKKQVEEAA